MLLDVNGVAKRKKRNKGKNSHQSQHVTVLAILERLEFKKFSCWPTMVADNTLECSMVPPL